MATKVVNGVRVPLTDEEEVEFAARTKKTRPAAKPKPVDILRAEIDILTKALKTKAVINQADLDAEKL